MTTATETLPELLTWRQLAEMLNVSIAHAFAMRRVGTLGPAPQTLGPRCRRFRRSEVEQWIAAGLPSRDKWLAMQLATKPARR